MNFNGMTRFQVGDYIGSALYTVSVEEKCQALAHKRVIGRDLAIDGIHARELHAAQLVFDWMVANGWTGGATPDLEALLSEE